MNYPAMFLCLGILFFHPLTTFLNAISYRIVASTTIRAAAHGLSLDFGPVPPAELGTPR